MGPLKSKFLVSLLYDSLAVLVDEALPDEVLFEDSGETPEVFTVEDLTDTEEDLAESETKLVLETLDADPENSFTEELTKLSPELETSLSIWD